MSTQKSKGVAWNPLPIVVDFEKIYISLPWSGGVMWSSLLLTLASLKRRGLSQIIWNLKTMFVCLSLSRISFKEYEDPKKIEMRTWKGILYFLENEHEIKSRPDPFFESFCRLGYYLWTFSFFSCHWRRYFSFIYSFSIRHGSGTSWIIWISQLNEEGLAFWKEKGTWNVIKREICKDAIAPTIPARRRAFAASVFHII